MTKFDRLKMKESESIDTFGGKLSELASNSDALSATIAEAKLVLKIPYDPSSKEVYTYCCISRASTRS